MKAALEYFRFLVVSYEAVIATATFTFIYFYRSEDIQYFSNELSNAEVLKFLALIPFFIFVWSFNQTRKMVLPDKDKSEILQSWPEYFKLKAGIFAGITWLFLFTILSVVSWISINDKNYTIGAIFLIGAILGSIVDGLSIFLAEISVNEQFCKGKDRQQNI